MAKSHKRENYMNQKIIPARRTEKVTYAIRDIAVKAKHLEDQGKKIIYLNIKYIFIC